MISGLSRFFTDLILRSRAQHGVSKDGPKRCGLWPSFETLLREAPQDEVVDWQVNPRLLPAPAK